MGQKALPMLVQGAIDYLETVVTSDMDVFEWGAGRSTQWFADRVKSIVSIEHQEKWFKIVSIYLKDRSNVNFLMIEQESDRYINVISDYDDESFDLLVIDGRRRVECISKALCKLKRGGYLLFDDVQRGRYRLAWPMFRSWPDAHEFEFRGKHRKVTGIYRKP